jgi:enoyl-CoA hydratase/carnithine racemase
VSSRLKGKRIEGPSQSEVNLEAVDGVAVITLARPERLNAFTRAMADQLVEAWDRCDADDSIRAVILTGAGRAFCAGADMSEGAAIFDLARGGDSVPVDDGGRVALRIHASRKPVIVAINGPAVGVGITMTLPADIRIAADHARIGFVFTRRGLVPEACSSWFLPRVVGIGKATEWVMTGRIFGAEEALAAGLVNEVVPGDDLLARAHAIAREIADNTAPVSVALARRMLWDMLGPALPAEAHRLESLALAERGRSLDAEEGVASFLEKRAPLFPDRVSEALPELSSEHDQLSLS